MNNINLSMLFRSIASPGGGTKENLYLVLVETMGWHILELEILEHVQVRLVTPEPLTIAILDKKSQALRLLLKVQKAPTCCICIRWRRNCCMSRINRRKQHRWLQRTSRQGGGVPRWHPGPEGPELGPCITTGVKESRGRAAETVEHVETCWGVDSIGSGRKDCCCC